MRRYRTLCAAMLASCLAVPARANVTIYYHAGGWDAFNGQASDGQPLCGVGSRNPTDGRTFSLSFELGSNEVTFVASKPSWNIPEHTQIPVVIQLGLDRPWAEQATGNAQRVQWTLSGTDMPSFDAQFRSSASMTVTFPTGNEKPWIVELNGSTAVSNAMGRCVRDMARRAPAPVSAAAPAPAGQEATQPFAAAPGTADAAPASGNAAPASGNAPPAAPADTSPATPGNAAPGVPADQGAPAQPNATAPAPSH